MFLSLCACFYGFHSDMECGIFTWKEICPRPIEMSFKQKIQSMSGSLFQNCTWLLSALTKMWLMEFQLFKKKVLAPFQCKPVAEGGGLEGQCPPQQEIKLKLCPTKLKFALAYFNYIYRSYKWLCFTLMVMSFLKRKTNNQGLFVVILMLICAWKTNILLWLSSLTARKLIILCLL